MALNGVDEVERLDVVTRLDMGRGLQRLPLDRHDQQAAGHRPPLPLRQGLRGREVAVRPHVGAVDGVEKRGADPAASMGRGDDELAGRTVAGGQPPHLVALPGEEVAVPHPGVGEPQEELLREGVDAVGAGGVGEQGTHRIVESGGGGQVTGLDLHGPQRNAGTYIEVYVPRSLLITVTVIAVLLGAGWLVDSLAAARFERTISREVQDAARLDVSPSVNVGGFPFLMSLTTGEIPSVDVHALDVDVADLGMVNATTRISEVTADRDQILNGDISGATARSFTRTIRLDGVALGRLLDMTDLDISHPYDISPAGGTAAEAQLTGTPFNQREAATVIVDLRLVGNEFRMTPRELVDAPADQTPAEEQAVRDAFTLTLDTRRLPLAGRASTVNMSGGSIFFEAQRFNVPIRMSALSPVEVTGPGD